MRIHALRQANDLHLSVDLKKRYSFHRETSGSKTTTHHRRFAVRLFEDVGAFLQFRSARAFAALSFALGSLQAAQAAAPIQIAFSEKLGAEVFANPDSSGEWCRESVSLSLLLKDDSPLLGAGLSDFIKRVGATLPAKCAEAKRARIAVYRDSDRKLVAGPYTITQADNWASPQNLGQADEPAKPAPPPAEPVAAPAQPADPQRAAKLAALAQQRPQMIAFLAQLPPEARLANFLSPNLGIDSMARLDNLASARGRSLQGHKPVSVRMLVQAGSGGADHVETRWPGHLRLTVPSGGPALESGQWYLVEGALSLEGPSEELKPAELSATSLFACKQEL